MKKVLVSAVFAATALTAIPATAATLFFIPGQNYAEKVHNDQQADGTSVTLLSKPSDYSVQYTADDTIHLNGNGFAQQDGPFSYLTIDPLGVDFTKIGLTVYADKDAKYNVTFDVLVNFAGGGSQILNAILPSNGKIDIWAENLEILDSIKIYNLMGSTSKDGYATSFDFEGVKHTSFDVSGGAVVPEPGTWAMMIIGFGAAGVMIRSSRRKYAAA
ncbi:MAG: PEPxxWA-CTERM sorting domain-containing protein [Pseudomonadota bacterium]